MAEQKVKDHQPPYQEPHEGVSSEELENGAERPDVKGVADEAGYNESDGMLRQTLRGDETRGDADERDIAGSTDFKDTPHGREETKNDKAGAANQNG